MTEIILTSSVLILVLAALRRVLGGRIPPGAQYALWLLAAARLLIPGTLFSAPVSVMGAAEELQTALQETFPDPNAAPVSPLTESRTDRPGPSPQAELPDGDAAASAPIEIGPPAFSFSRWDFIDWPDVLWKAGMAVTGGTLAASNGLFALRLRKTRRQLELPDAVRAGKLPVYAAAGLPSPCLSGVFRPAVYLNEAAMGAAHPEHILAHEYTHYRHGDHLWSILRSICLVIHWYNPLVWWAAALCRRDCELACDAAALRLLGEEARIGYGQTLLEMVSGRPSPAALLRTATTMTAGKRAMSERIALIARRPRTRKLTLALAALLACVLAACSFGGGAEKAPLQTPPSEPSPLLEFPGLLWNDSPEAVMEALGVTETDFLQSTELEDVLHQEWFFTVGDLPCLGGTAEEASFRFLRYKDTDSALGLYQVQLCFPDEMEDFGQVRERLAQRFGPGTEELAAVPAGPEIRDILGDRYARWEALQEQEGPRAVRWDVGAEALEEELLEDAREGSYQRQRLSGEDFDRFLEGLPLAAVSWSDCAVPAPTFNTVTFEASKYVLCLQMAETARAGGTDVLAEALERLPEADRIWYSSAGKFGAASNGTLPPGSLSTLETAFRACRWAEAEAPGDGFVYWDRVSVGQFTFYDSSPLVSYCHYDGPPYEGMSRTSYGANGEMDWYYVPEGYLTIQAALHFESDSALSLEKKKALYLYQQARLTWDAFQTGHMWERYNGIFETDEGMWPSVGFFESIEDLRGFLETVFSPEIAEQLLATQKLQDRGGRLHYLQGEAPYSLYAGEETVEVYPIGPGEATWMAYNGRVLARTEVLGEDLETVTGYREHEFLYKWNGTHYVFTSFGPWDDVMS